MLESMIFFLTKPPRKGGFDEQNINLSCTRQYLFAQNTPYKGVLLSKIYIVVIARRLEDLSEECGVFRTWQVLRIFPDLDQRGTRKLGITICFTFPPRLRRITPLVLKTRRFPS
jgi:hypothetical protein